jgi:lia operon protein LiaG
VSLGIRRMIARSTPAATAGLALLFGLTLTDVSAQERVPISGNNVAIYNLAGRVVLEAGSGSDVTVDVSRGGGDASQLRIETGRIDDANTLRVVYPSSRVVASFLSSNQHTKVRVRDNGTFSDHGSDRGSQVTISGEGNGLEAWADLTIKIPSGKAVSVYLAVGRIEATNLDGDIRLDTHSAPVMASDIRGSLDVDVGSGSVDLSRVTGTLRVDTGSGGVKVNDVDSDVIDIDTGSGGVSGGSITAATIGIDTGSGGIELDNVAGDRLAMDTGSGHVRLTLTRVPQHIDVDTGSGGVTIRAPNGLNAMIELETGSGSIETDFPITIQRHSRDHVQGQIGDGSGRVTIETGSGSIRLLNTAG